MITFVLLLALATLVVVGTIIMTVFGWSIFMLPWLDAMVCVAIIALIVKIFKFFTRKRT